MIEERDKLRRLVDVYSDDPSPQETKMIPFEPGQVRKSYSPHVFQIRSVGHETSTNYDSPQPGTEFEIDEIKLDFAAVQELLDQYVMRNPNSSPMELMLESFRSHYLHHLPVLDIQIPASYLLKDSPLLFWTTIIIAARDHLAHATFSIQLQLPYKRLLSTYLSKSICCVHTIQALLLLCTWPFLVRNQNDDPSWATAGSLLQLLSR